MRILTFIAWCSIFSLTTAPVAAQAPVEPIQRLARGLGYQLSLPRQVLSRSISVLGDTSRVKRFAGKLLSGEHIFSQIQLVHRPSSSIQARPSHRRRAYEVGLAGWERQHMGHQDKAAVVDQSAPRVAAVRGGRQTRKRLASHVHRSGFPWHRARWVPGGTLLARSLSRLPEHHQCYRLLRSLCGALPCAKDPE